MKGFFRVAPYAHLGMERNAAARQMGVDASHPLQTGRGWVILMVLNKRPVGHIVFPDRIRAQRGASAWLQGRGHSAECFLGHAIGSFRGRMLFQFVEGVRLQRMDQHLDEMRIAKAGGFGTPLDPNEFDRIDTRLSQKLNDIAKKGDTQAMKRVLNDLAKVKNVDVLQQAAQQSINEQFKAVPGQIVPPQSVELTRQGRSISMGTRQGINEKFNLGISQNFSAFDERIGKHLVGSHANFVRDEYGKRSESLSRQARNIINRGQKQGLGLGEIQADLAQTLGTSNVLRSQSYWATVSNAFVNRSRTFTAFGGYREAGVTLYQISSVLDEATTDTCRFLHGKVLDLDRALANFDQQAALDDPLDLKTVNPWIREMKVGPNRTPTLALNPPSGPGGKKVFKPIATVTRSGLGTQGTGKFSKGVSNQALMDGGIHGPPYHGRCRTDVIPVIRTLRAPRSPRARTDTVGVGETAVESLKRREADVKGFGGASLMLDETDIEGMSVRFRQINEGPRVERGSKKFMATFKLTEHAAERLQRVARERFSARASKFKLRGGSFTGTGVRKFTDQTLKMDIDSLKFTIDGVDIEHVLQEALKVKSDTKFGAWRNMVKVTLPGKNIEEAFQNFSRSMGSWGIGNPGGFPTARALETAKKAAIIARFSPKNIKNVNKGLRKAIPGQEHVAVDNIFGLIASKEMKAALADAELREVFPGYSTFFSKSLAAKVKKDVPLFYHTTMGTNNIRALLDPTRGKGGLKSSVYRFDQGSSIKGLGTAIDFGSGGGDGVFVRAWDGKKIARIRRNQAQIYVKSDVAGRLDWWGYNQDFHGSSGSALHNKRLSVDSLLSTVKNGSLSLENELAFRGGIEIQDMERVFIGDFNERDRIIRDFADRGIKEINGLKLGEFIMNPQGNAKFLKSKAKT